MEAHVITCRSTADFLAALPEITGFSATESLFLVFFSEHRAEHAARLNLPDDADLTDAEAGAWLDAIEQIVREAMRATGASANPAIVITASRSFAESGGAPHRALADRIERRLLRDGIELRERCVRASDGWGSYDDPFLPTTGHPLSAIEESRVARVVRDRGRDIPDLDTWGDIPHPNPRRVRAISDYLRDYRDLDFPGAEGLPPRHSAPGNTLPEVWTPLAETADIAQALRGAQLRLRPRMTARLIRAVQHSDRWFMLALALLTSPEFPTRLAQQTSPGRFRNIAIRPDSMGSPPGESETIGPDRDGASQSRTAASPAPWEWLTDLPNWSICGVLGRLRPTRQSRDRLQSIRPLLLGAVAECPQSLRPRLLALSSWVWWMTGIQTVAHRHAALASEQSRDDELVTAIEALVDAPAPFFESATGAGAA